VATAVSVRAFTRVASASDRDDVTAIGRESKACDDRALRGRESDGLARHQRARESGESSGAPGGTPPILDGSPNAGRWKIGAQTRKAAQTEPRSMGHAKVDTTLNVYTQVIDGSLRAAVDKVGSELFTIVHNPKTGEALSHLKNWLLRLDSNQQPSG
jgi:hypothetical protein